MQDRRTFLTTTAAAGTLAALSSSGEANIALPKGNRMALGLVTYLWGQDWDLPTLIENCEKTKVLGLELRTQHKHGVEINLNAKQRRDVRKRFEDSPVTLLGPGTNWEFHSPDPAKLKHNIENAKKYVVLSHDCGGTGVKVKPNQLPKGVPHEKTIAQIGKSLSEVAEYAEGFGQQIRVEVHGRDTQKLPVMKKIMDAASHPGVTVCWNCNQADLEGKGLEHNFNLVKDRFGATCHVRELNDKKYPYAKLVDLLVGIDYAGWVLLECRTKPKDRIAALIQQRNLFETLRRKAQVKS